MTTFTIISAIICILIVFLILRNMYEEVRHGYYNDNPTEEKVKLPLFVYLIALVVCLIPIVNIIATVAFIIWIIACHDEFDITIKGPIGKIVSFLNKKI